MAWLISHNKTLCTGTWQQEIVCMSVSLCFIYSGHFSAFSEHGPTSNIHFRLDESLQIKVGDFGVSKMDEHFKEANNFLAIRWMSPESVSSGVFSTKSDVVSVRNFFVEKL